MRRDFVREITQANESNIDLSLAIGWKLTKSRKPYLVYLFAKHFFVFALTGQQAKNLKVDPGGMRGVKLTLSIPTPPATNFPCVINQLEIDNCRKLDGSARITGRLRYELTRPFIEPVAIVLEFSLKAATIKRHYTYPPHPFLSISGVLELGFSPIRGADDTATSTWYGATVAFCRFTTIPNPQKPAELQPLSNPYGVLLDVLPVK
jgi:hypothetical protein